MLNNVVDNLPIWVIGVLLLSLIGAATAFGARMRARIDLKSDSFPATSASVTLLALLIGFTFSVALNRYDTRRALVVEEAGAVTMVWERVRLEPDDVRNRMQPLVQAYVDQRLTYFENDVRLERQRAADKASEDIQNALWAITRNVVESDIRPLITRSIIDGLTRVDDAAWQRESAAREHIPTLVIDLLILFALITAAIIGYSTSNQRSVNRPINIAFLTLLTLAILMVLDLDRPLVGLVRVSQQPMLELKAEMIADVAAQNAVRAP